MESILEELRERIEELEKRVKFLENIQECDICEYPERLNVCYIRVSTHNQVNDLERQRIMMFKIALVVSMR